MDGRRPVLFFAGFIISTAQAAGQGALPIFEIVDQRDQSGNLTHYTRDFTEYNNNGKLSIRTTSNWNDSQQSYIIASVAESYDDAQGRDTLNRNSYYKHYPDSLTTLVESGYTWNDKNQLTSLRSLFQSAPEIRNEYRVQFMRNTNGCKSRDITHWYYNGTIYDETITDYTTDANCNIVVAATYSTVNLNDQKFTIIYDYTGNLLIRQRTYTLYPDSLLTFEANYQYNSLSQLTLEQLGNYTRLIFGYDAQGRTTLARTESSSDDGNTWVPAVEDLTSYDSQGRTTLQTRNLQWNSSGSYWQQTIITSTTYNEFGKSSEQIRTDNFGSSGLVSETAQETNYSYRCDGVVSEMTISITSGLDPGMISRTTYQYLTRASCDANADQVLVIFPNPATTTLQVLVREGNKPASVKIFESSGQLVKEFAVGLNPGIYDISELSPGLYIVEAGGGMNGQRSRLVKY